MPYKSKCFSTCRNLKLTKCRKNKHCRTIKSYTRSIKGQKERLIAHCRITNEYKLSNRKTRKGRCRMIKKH
jgi:hypothetical protein